MIFRKKTDSEEGAKLLSKRNVFDVHTHILPGIDDGSQSVEQSMMLLRELSKQGIKTVIATPHYYPTQKTPEAFLEERNRAYELIREDIDDSLPKVKLGAEVMYFRGISRIESLERLCVEGTKTLLLEMPTDPWSEYMLRETAEIQNMKNINVVMAHIERYFEKQSSEFIEQLLSFGVKMQINASSLLGKQRRRLIKMLRSGAVSFIGSDCHDMTARGIEMAKAAAVIRDYSDEEILDRLEDNCKRYF